MPDISKMRKLGKRTIEVLEYGGQRTENKENKANSVQ